MPKKILKKKARKIPSKMDRIIDRKNKVRKKYT